MCGKEKQENKKTTNMQTNSPPKLDTPKHTCIFHYHKQSMYLPLNKTNRIHPTFQLDLPFLSRIDKGNSIKSKHTQ